MRLYTWLWIGWVAYFLALETWALLRPARGDTFSEHIWYLRDRLGSFFWFMLAGFLFWLVYHFLIEKP